MHTKINGKGYYDKMYLLNRLHLFYKGKEKIEDKQVNNDFLLKLKNVSLFVVTNSSSVTGLPGLTLFLLREPEVRGTTFKT